MRYLGVVIIVLVSLSVSNSYRKYSERRLVYIEGFLSFLSFVRKNVYCSLKPILRIADDFQDEGLSYLGFLDEARHRGVKEAYLTVRKRAGLPSDVDRLLLECFSELGTSYPDTELKLLDSTLGELDKLLERERGATASGVRLFYALTLSLAFGFIILVW